MKCHYTLWKNMLVDTTAKDVLEMGIFPYSSSVIFIFTLVLLSSSTVDSNSSYLSRPDRPNHKGLSDKGLQTIGTCIKLNLPKLKQTNTCVWWVTLLNRTWRKIGCEAILYVINKPTRTLYFSFICLAFLKFHRLSKITPPGVEEFISRFDSSQKSAALFLDLHR